MADLGAENNESVATFEKGSVHADCDFSGEIDMVQHMVSLSQLSFTSSIPVLLPRRFSEKNCDVTSAGGSKEVPFVVPACIVRDDSSVVLGYIIDQQHEYIDNPHEDLLDKLILDKDLKLSRLENDFEFERIRTNSYQLYNQVDPIAFGSSNDEIVYLFNNRSAETILSEQCLHEGLKPFGRMVSDSGQVEEKCQDYNKELSKPGHETEIKHYEIKEHTDNKERKDKTSCVRNIFTLKNSSKINKEIDVDTVHVSIVGNLTKSKNPRTNTSQVESRCKTDSVNKKLGNNIFNCTLRFHFDNDLQKFLRND